jgi:hypothetical protein
VITSDIPASKWVLLMILSVTGGILLLSHCYQHPLLSATKEIHILLILDAGLVMYYTMQGRANQQTINRLDRRSLEKPFFKGAFNIGEQLRRNTMFFMIYVSFRQYGSQHIKSSAESATA